MYMDKSLVLYPNYLCNSFLHEVFHLEEPDE